MVNIVERSIESVPRRQSKFAKMSSRRKNMATSLQSPAKDPVLSDEGLVRGHWSSKAEFLLSCLGLSVGLGNLWRFPFLAYRYGGAAFIIAYVILQLLIGNPVYFMELAMGQYSGQGPTLVFRCNPVAKGVGFAMAIAGMSLTVYYAAVLALCIFYMFASMQSELPWKKCEPEWLPYNCWVYHGKEGQTIPNCGTNYSANYTGLCKCMYDTTVDFNFAACPDVDQRLPYHKLAEMSHDKTLNCSLLACTNFTKAPGHFYLYNSVLETTNRTLSDIGVPLWDMSLCLLLVWIITVLAAMKGIKASGKVVYFTATFPYVMILILLIRTATLPGSVEGITHFLVPEWEKLRHLNLWLAAGGQMFFSLSISCGPIIALGSYNTVHNDCFIDAIVVTFGDLGTSLLAGVTVFMMLGAMSLQRNVPFNEVANQGYGLAFVTYPEALAELPFPQIWSSLFFLMLFTLGIDTEFGFMECNMTILTDEFPKLLKYKAPLTIGFGVCFYMMGLPLVSPGGYYLINLLDTYGYTYALYLICFAELISIIWMYDVMRLMKDLHYMLRYRPRPAIYWVGCWTLVAPILVIGIGVTGIARSEISKYTKGMGTSEYPEDFEPWTLTLGWVMTGCILIPIPIVAVWVLLHVPGGTLRERLKNGMTPDPLWQAQDKGTQEDHITYITS